MIVEAVVCSGGVNRNVEGRTVRRVLGYNGNGAHFRRTTDEVAKGGYQEFAFPLVLSIRHLEKARG